VFLATWLLTIAAFSPVQVLIGLPLYVLVFPFTVLGALLFHRVLNADTPPSANAPGLQPARRSPLTRLWAALLVGWFLLYSGSSSRGPNLAGFLLSLALFLALVYQALDKTSPIDEHDTAFFSSAAVRGILVVTNLFKKAR